MKVRTAGFTLIEILVVMVIISILASVLYASFNDGTSKSRDAQRQADLYKIQTALELYKNQYGVYPDGCNGPTASINNPVFSGQIGSTYQCSATDSQYIVGLAPEFVPVLPIDPKLNGANSGYVYLVNNEGSVYKIMALNTVETESITLTHDFFRCSPYVNQAGFGNTWDDPNMCGRTPSVPSGNNNGAKVTINACTSPSNYNTTYSVSGGFSSDVRGNTNTPDRGREYDTEIVRCN